MSWRSLAAAGILAALGAGVEACAAEITVLPVPGRVLAVEPHSGRALVTVGGSGRLWFEAAPDGRPRVGEPPAGPRVLVALEGLLPQSASASGEGMIRQAWLADATDRYRHGVLGDRLEAATLRVRLGDGTKLDLQAGGNAVFEDLFPRLADLDGAEPDEIVVVKSYLDRGAALAVVGLRGGKLEILDETPPIGRPNRWLNPVGVADFDGDGRVEIAYVETPHIGGRLMIWEWRAGRLEREHAETGFSNHAIGSTELRLSAIADMDGDGLVDLAVPNRYRDRLRLISLAAGRFDELADIPLDGAVATAIAPVGDHLILGLEDGRLIAIRPHLP